jgi:hypothetical protein
MAELDLWRSVLDQDAFQELEAANRLALISIGVQVADDRTDGFLSRGAVRRVPWREGPQDLLDRIGELTALGWLEAIDDPPGWQVAGWSLDSPGRARNKGGGQTGWGQMPAAMRQSREAKARERSQRHRDRLRAREGVRDA